METHESDDHFVQMKQLIEMSEDPALKLQVKTAYLTGSFDGNLDSVGILIAELRKLFGGALNGDSLPIDLKTLWHIVEHFRCAVCDADLIVETHRNSCAVAKAHRIFAEVSKPVPEDKRGIPEGVTILDRATYYERLAREKPPSCRKAAAPLTEPSTEPSTGKSSLPRRLP